MRIFIRFKKPVPYSERGETSYRARNRKRPEPLLQAVKYNVKNRDHQAHGSKILLVSMQVKKIIAII